MKKWLMAVLLGTLLVLGACGGSNDNNTDKGTNNGGANTEEPNNNGDNADGNNNASGEVDVAAAEAIYKDNCSSCHGGNLTGGMHDLDKVGAKLSKEEILSVIENGAPPMPANIITGDDAELVASWLATQK